MISFVVYNADHFSALLPTTRKSDLISVCVCFLRCCLQSGKIIDVVDNNMKKCLNLNISKKSNPYANLPKGFNQGPSLMCFKKKSWGDAHILYLDGLKTINLVNNPCRWIKSVRGVVEVQRFLGVSGVGLHSLLDPVVHLGHPDAANACPLERLKWNAALMLFHVPQLKIMEHNLEELLTPVKNCYFCTLIWWHIQARPTVFQVVIYYYPLATGIALSETPPPPSHLATIRKVAHQYTISGWLSLS